MFLDKNFDCSDLKILIDTREQKPLKFKVSESLKLDLEIILLVVKIIIIHI